MGIKWLLAWCLSTASLGYAGDITKPDGYDYKGGEADYSKMSDAIVSQYLKTIPREIEVVGLGGSFTGEVRYVRTAFKIKAKVDPNQARNVIVPEAKKIMALFDASKKIRPYLHNFPFTHRNVSYSLSFRDKRGEYYTDGSVAFACICKDGISYAVHNPITNQFEDILVESWDEAVKKYEAYALSQEADAKNVANVAKKNSRLRR